MNKSAIKNFAVRARNRLIEDITQKSYELGITNNEIKDVETFEGGFKIKGLENSKIYKKYEVKQREKLVSKIKEKGFEQVVEEVAYTWFNRFIALRFMEVNEYLPTGVRVLSSLEEGKTEPDIIKEALNIDLDIDKEIVYRLIDKNDTEDLFKYLLIKQCNQLGEIMPMVFEEIADYTELLLPNNLLAEGSVIRDLVESIDEDDYKDQVEIIGWMYQYYISEKKDEVFEGLKNNKKITKENIPAATQLFTPKWIVKYMVENSLGRLWLESHPDEDLKTQWKYYLEEAEQDPEVKKKLDELKSPNLNPEDIKVLDPAMGSGHILVYAFDVLYDIYLKANYSERDIPQLILEKNLYGLDIDDRAGQLAAFALMMKARSKNRRIFRKRIDLNVCSIQESNGIPQKAIEYLVNLKETAIEKTIHRDEVEYLIEVFRDAKEYGSIIDVKKIDFDVIERRIEEITSGETVNLFELQYKDILVEKLPSLIRQAKIMSDKYDVVCTNPPYMGSKGMGEKLNEYIKKNYENSKGDLYAVMLEKSIKCSRGFGFVSHINQQSWMFLTSYENLRKRIINNNTFINMIHLGPKAFEEIGGEVVQTVTFTLRNGMIDDYRGKFIRAVDISNANEKKEYVLNTLKNSEKEIYKISNRIFKNIPNNIIAYWISKEFMEILESEKTLGTVADVRKGLITSDNNRFLRLWHEVNFQKLGIGYKNAEVAQESKMKWFPYVKGGKYRKWYGNYENVINYYNDGEELKAWVEELTKTKPGGRIINREYYYKKGITWSSIGTSKTSFRYVDYGSIYSNTGMGIFSNKVSLYYLIGFLNSIVAEKLLNIISPTMGFEAIYLTRIPIRYNFNIDIEHKVITCLNISKQDWDLFEDSWDFVQHPLIAYSSIKNDFTDNNIETAFNRWSNFTNEKFEQLKYNEEELNKIFIDIYGLQNELTPEIEDKDITINKADRARDIKSFISYAAGCMFGRYSLDVEGLVFAGGQFDINKYKTFIPTQDNVLVIANDDYFEDDILNRFVEFVKVTFGKKTLEENLDYIAETLGQKSSETSRQTIRRYFLKDFYNDHVKTYSKRPIYWLFDSGKENGFKALIYMHRYDASTVARVRTDYLHKLQKMYEAEVKRLDILIESDLSAREKAAAMKKRDSINKQISECLTYDQVIAHVANQKVEIDLDDGTVVNYEKFQGVQIPQGEGKKPLKANLLAKI